MKAAKWALRLEVIAAYGGKCVCCGEATPEFMSIDHINGRGKEHRDGVMRATGQNLYAWLRANGFPKDEYRLLCCNCNLARGFFGACPHETR